MTSTTLCYCMCHPEPIPHMKGKPYEHCVDCRRKELGFDYERGIVFS